MGASRAQKSPFFPSCCLSALISPCWLAQDFWALSQGTQQGAAGDASHLLLLVAAKPYNEPQMAWGQLSRAVAAGLPESVASPDKGCELLITTVALTDLSCLGISISMPVAFSLPRNKQNRNFRRSFCLPSSARLGCGRVKVAFQYCREIHAEPCASVAGDKSLNNSPQPGRLAVR